MISNLTHSLFEYLVKIKVLIIEMIAHSLGSNIGKMKQINLGAHGTYMKQLHYSLSNSLEILITKSAEQNELSLEEIQTLKTETESTLNKIFNSRLCLFAQI